MCFFFIHDCAYQIETPKTIFLRTVAQQLDTVLSRLEAPVLAPPHLTPPTIVEPTTIGQL